MAGRTKRVDAFRDALQDIFREAETQNLTSITVTSKLLAQRVGKSKRDKYDEMEPATRVLRQQMQDGRDSEMSSPPKGRGSSFKIQFAIPRDNAAVSNHAVFPGISRSTAETYLEGRRVIRETIGFLRNPKLVADAKAAHGKTCKACGFNFQSRYGELGVGYIECHHIDPISGRGGKNMATTIEQVIMLCANCHRMIHRLPGAMTVHELKLILEQNGHKLEMACQADC